MNDSAKVALALLAGLAAGVVVGVLFAPDKGADTRDKFTDSLKGLGDSIKDRIANEFSHLTKGVVKDAVKG